MGLKDLSVRVRLPWKTDPREARRLYKRIVRSPDPEAAARELNRSLRK